MELLDDISLLILLFVGAIVVGYVLKWIVEWFNNH